MQKQMERQKLARWPEQGGGGRGARPPPAWMAPAPAALGQSETLCSFWNKHLKNKRVEILRQFQQIHSEFDMKFLLSIQKPIDVTHEKMPDHESSGKRKSKPQCDTPSVHSMATPPSPRKKTPTKSTKQTTQKITSFGKDKQKPLYAGGGNIKRYSCCEKRYGNSTQN